MKKASFFAFLLCLALVCASLSSCFFFGSGRPWEEGKLTNTFFSTDYLSERGVADFPVPKLEGSYFDPDDHILYLNLTREEFGAYAGTVAHYLREKEELKVKGYFCGSDIWGLLIIPVRIIQLAPLDDEYIPYGDDKQIFGFSTQVLAEEHSDQIEIKDPKFVSLEWSPTTQKSGTTYTVIMEFPHYYHAEYLPCHNGHDFASSTYPVPGTEFTTTLHTCTRCGEEEREGYGYGGDLKKFSWTVVEGTEHLVSGIHKEEYRGSLVEIAAIPPKGKILKMTINGTEIPVAKEQDGQQIFAFIMPYGNIEITIEAIGHEHTGRWHSNEEAHWYEYTCGCESPDIAELHLDSENDGLCDVCAYMVGPKQYHPLMINSPEWLYEKLKQTYHAGETVSVKISMATDIGFLFFVNGEEITDYQDNSGLYWEFTFPMPNCETYIHFKTYDGFLPHMNYATLIETYYRQNLDSGYVYVKHYYGEFASGTIAAMLDTGAYDDAMWEEVIGDTVIHYNNGNRILALCPNNKFYTLTEAFENGYLTAEDIAAIAEMHNNQ